MLLKRTVSSRWLFWVPSTFAWAWKFRIQISIDLSSHALLVLKRTCLGVEILKTNSYLSFEACVVGDQNNRLIETAVLSTPILAWVWRFCVQIPIYLSRHVLLVLKQSSHRDSCLEYPQLILGCRNFKYKFLSLLLGMCCRCSREPSHRDGCFGYPHILHGRGNFEYEFLSIFRGMCCWCSKEPSH